MQKVSLEATIGRNQSVGVSQEYAAANVLERESSARSGAYFHE